MWTRPPILTLLVQSEVMGILKGQKKKSGSGPTTSLTSTDISAHHQGPGRPKQQQSRLTTEVRIVVCILYFQLCLI
jgi:hypothetical protein